jgi:MoxR-like ATPase
MNPSEQARYGGTKTLNEALLDRFPVVIRMDYLSENEEVAAVIAQSGQQDEGVVRRMVRCANEVRAAIGQEKVFGSFSTRRVTDWARMSLQFDVRESADVTVLSKLNPFDAEVVEDIVDNYF